MMNSSAHKEKPLTQPHTGPENHGLQDAVLEDAKDRAQQLSRAGVGERFDHVEDEGPGPAEGHTDNKAGG
jgi:hypothetical protein